MYFITYAKEKYAVDICLKYKVCDNFFQCLVNMYDLIIYDYC